MCQVHLVITYIPPDHLHFTFEGNEAQRGKVQVHMTVKWQKLNSYPGPSVELVITASLH